MDTSGGRVSPVLEENRQYLRGRFAGATDLMVRELDLGGAQAALFALDGLVDKESITLGILNPLLQAAARRRLPRGGDRLEEIERRVLGSMEQKRETDREKLLTLLMSGYAVLCVEGCAAALAFGVQGFTLRSPEEPESEVMQRGGNEGFIESLQANTAMLRRRLKTTALRMEPLELGGRSRTPVTLCYLEDRADPATVAGVREKLNASGLNAVLGAGYLTAFLGAGGLFSGVGVTERPDVVCGKLEEGRVAVLVEGTPDVLLVPFLFIECFQTMDDYLAPPLFAGFVRWVKAVGFLLSAMLPGFYVAVAVHHPELLPESLLLKIAQSEAQTPLPVLAETLLLYFLYEMLREAGLRAPRPLSATVSIVGGLVIGDTAVSAGLVSAPSLLVVALTAIAGYTVPRLYDQLSLLRLGFLLAGGLLGVFGVMAGFFLLLLELCAAESFGVPLLAPLAPFRPAFALRDVLARQSWLRLREQTVRVSEMPGAKGSDDRGKA